VKINNLSSPPLFLANNFALDLITSEYETGDSRHDCSESAQSVVDWLGTTGLVPKGTEAPPEFGG